MKTLEIIGDVTKIIGSPRLRGYYWSLLLASDTVFGSPPLTRVLPVIQEIFGYCLGITPAYAGTTKLFDTSISSFQDHPRLRGYYTSSDVGWPMRTGSPPAYAGTTTHRRFSVSLL